MAPDLPPTAGSGEPDGGPEPHGPGEHLPVTPSILGCPSPGQAVQPVDTLNIKEEVSANEEAHVSKCCDGSPPPLRESQDASLEEGEGPQSDTQGLLKTDGGARAVAVKQKSDVWAHRRGVLLQMIASFFLSSMVALAKLLETGSRRGVELERASQDMPVLEVVLVRSLIVCVSSLSFLAKDRTNPFGQPPCLLMLHLRGALGAGAVILIFYAAALLPLLEVTVLTLTMPIWGAIFGRLCLKEPLSKALIAVFPVCAVGVLLIAHPWSSGAAQQSGEATSQHGESTSISFHSIGVALALLQAVVSAGAKTCVRALGKSGQHPQVVVFYLTIFGTSASSFVLFGFQGGFVRPANWQWALLTAVGLCAFGSQTFSTLALRSISVSEGAIVNYLSLVWSELYGYLAFHETPSASSFSGAGIVVLCTLSLLLLSG